MKNPIYRHRTKLEESYFINIELFKEKKFFIFIKKRTNLFEDTNKSKKKRTER